MRISTSWANQTGIDKIIDQQSRVNQLQMKLSANKKIINASDDPSGAARVIDLNQTLEQTDQHQKNILTARYRLSLSDSVLKNAVEDLQKVRELGVQALNGTNSATDRLAIAEEIQSLNGHLLGLANTRNASGESMYAGFKADTPAFIKSGVAGGYEYNGDGNQRNIQIAPDRYVTDGNAGTEIFGVPAGGSSPAGGNTNIFEALDQFVMDLRSNSPQAASIADIDKIFEQMQMVQASVGARLNALDVQENSNAAYKVDMKTVLSQTQDLDYAEAISQFNLQSTTLQAAQQAYTQVKKLSLFNYL